VGVGVGVGVDLITQMLLTHKPPVLAQEYGSQPETGGCVGVGVGEFDTQTSFTQFSPLSHPYAQSDPKLGVVVSIRIIKPTTLIHNFFMLFSFYPQFSVSIRNRSIVCNNPVEIPSGGKCWAIFQIRP
jgi:hypothetical protein